MALEDLVKPKNIVLFSTLASLAIPSYIEGKEAQAAPLPRSKIVMRTVLPGYSRTDYSRIDKQITAIRTKYKSRPRAYRRNINKSVHVANKYKHLIRRYAIKHGVPVEVYEAIIALENGGGTTKRSGTGPCGIAQIARSTAKKLGLRVNKNCRGPRYVWKTKRRRRGRSRRYRVKLRGDDRRNVYKSLNAGAKLLAQMFSKYGRWDLTIQAYHDGETKVNKAISRWVKKHKKVNVPSGKVNGNIIRKYNIRWIDIYRDNGVTKRVYGRSDWAGKNYVWKALLSRRMMYDRKLRL